MLEDEIKHVSKSNYQFCNKLNHSLHNILNKIHVNHLPNNKKSFSKDMDFYGFC